VTEVAKLSKGGNKNGFMAAEKKWFVLYTKPRWEKKIHQLLDAKEIENYCPLNKVSKKWSDRMKIVEEPLFKSYVFVKVSEEEQTKVRMARQTCHRERQRNRDDQKISKRL
jgi:Transcription termination factor nusG